MGSLHIPESSCSYLLQELKLIWDEVGSDQLEKDRILLELEQECLEVYKRKVDSANIRRSRLHQALADSEAEFTNLLISLGERSFAGRMGCLPAEVDMDSMMWMGSRPSTSSKRIPNRNLNNTFITAIAASSPNNRPPSGYGGIKKLGGSNNPSTQVTSPNIFRESKKMQIRRMLAHYNNGCSPRTADAATEISATFSGPTSP